MDASLPDYICGLAITARLLIGNVFILAGIRKWRTREWKDLPRMLGLLPNRLLELVLSILPLGELLVGASLIFGVAYLWVLATATALLALFTAVLIIGIQRGYQGSCHCFGARDDRPLSGGHIARNGSLLVIVLLLIANARRNAYAGWPLWRLDHVTLLLALIGEVSAGITYKILGGAYHVLQQIQGAETVRKVGINE